MLLFPLDRTSDVSHSGLIGHIWPHIEQLNLKSPPHARITRQMVFVASHKEAPLEKSSKGTLLRNQAEQRFDELITAAYENAGSSFDERGENDGAVAVPDSAVLQSIKEIIASVTSSKTSLDKDADLFSQGVDSVACMQIRGLVQKVMCSRSLLEKCLLAVIGSSSSSLHPPKHCL